MTNNFLPDGLKVLFSLGFRYVTIATWAKDRIGLGQYRRGQTEQLLFGVKGNLPYKTDRFGKRCQASTLIGGKILPRGESHSVKPPEARREIELISYGPYLELFAREIPEPHLFHGKMVKWYVWGNEIESDIEL